MGLPNRAVGDDCPVVEALQALRGVAIAVAVGVVAKVGDMRPFDNPRRLMAYLGLTLRCPSIAASATIM
jgi:transposase